MYNIIPFALQTGQWEILYKWRLLARNFTSVGFSDKPMGEPLL
jgi:hypothetical protein